MNKKTLRNVALLIVIVFAVTIIVYPLIYNTDQTSPIEPPVQLEVE